MKEALNRPVIPSGSSAGLFRNDHFQICYATNDLERARDVFGERFGVKEFRRMGGSLPKGGQVRIELGWAGGMMFELAWADGPGSEVFMAGLPTDRFAMRHHHFGYFVPTATAWDAVQREIEQGGWKVLHNTNVPGLLQACIIEVPELGHNLEYIFPEPAGIAFLEATPGN